MVCKIGMKKGYGKSKNFINKIQIKIYYNEYLIFHTVFPYFISIPFIYRTENFLKFIN